MPGLPNNGGYETITVEELHPTFAAEVKGVDFARLSEKQFKEVTAALAKVSVSVTS
jgi:alpha-ketoglutarate-dependent 2,4-dichlorophenoxyacetate dioxygenase